MTHRWSCYNKTLKGTTSNIHFFDLPLELRDMVYEHACEGVRVVYDIGQSTPQIQAYEAFSELENDPKFPVSDENHDATLLVSKRFNREVRDILFSKRQVVLVAYADMGCISPKIDWSSFARNIRHLEMSIDMLRQKQWGSLFPNLEQVAIIYDYGKVLVETKDEDSSPPEEAAVRIFLVKELNRYIIKDRELMSRIPNRRQATTDSSGILLKGTFTTFKKTWYRNYQKKPNYRKMPHLIITVYKNDYTYDLESKTLTMLPLREIYVSIRRLATPKDASEHGPEEDSENSSEDGPEDTKGIGKVKKPLRKPLMVLQEI